MATKIFNYHKDLGSIDFVRASGLGDLKRESRDPVDFTGNSSAGMKHKFAGFLGKNVYFGAAGRG